MSQKLVNVDDRSYKLSLSIVLDTRSNILDLSGKTPFVIHGRIFRRPAQGRINPEAHGRPVDVMVNGSLLDVSSALKTGLVSLVELEDDSSKQARKLSTKSQLSRELICDSAHEPSTEPPRTFRLLSGFLVPPTEHQSFECSLDESIVSVLKDGSGYALKHGKEAYPEHGKWNGGITWWKLCLDPDQPVDVSALTDEPPAEVPRAVLPRFKAMMNPPRPPKIEYELEISPTKISLSDTSPIKINVRFRLSESTRYTVMWRKSSPGSNITALGTNRLGSFSFDIFDTDTGEKISGTPMYANALWSPGLSSAPFKRDQLRELRPDQTYVGEAEPYGGENKEKSFLKYFRITDINRVLGRRLELRLKSVDTFWSEKSIDELFEHEDTIKKDSWYVPLTIQSPAVAEFSVTT